MINSKLIYKILGKLLFIEASMMLICTVVAIYYHEDDIPAFLTSIGITFFTGFTLEYFGRNAENTLARRDAYLVVTLTWIVFSLMGTLPFILSGYIPSLTDAYFETMSGFTTTGATIIDDVESFPHGLLFWRSLTHWIGGLGIVFFTIAILPSLSEGSIKVFAAEATGPIKSKLHPRLSVGARWIWAVYLFLTIACVLSYVACGMNWFDGANYAMSTTATGGFSTHNTSVEYFHSPALDYTVTLFCFLSGVNFMLLFFSVAKLRFKDLFRNSEFKFYSALVIGFTAIIMFELITHNHYNIEHAFRSSIFHVVSFITTTGFFNEDAGLWPHTTWVILAMCMFFGASSGSTCGGLKCVRGVMIIKALKNQFRQILHPNAVLPLKIDGVNVTMQSRVTLLAFLSTYLIICLVCSFILIALGIDNTNAITITLSSMGNVGPTLGTQIGPVMSWSSLPHIAKWMCSFMMLLGRLEIFTVLVIFTPQFWKEN